MSTALVAIAGIIGTLSATIVAGRQARSNQRAGEHDRHRIEVYSELLVLAYELLDQLEVVVMEPDRSADGVSNEAIKRCRAKIQILASPEVRESSDRMGKAFAAFWRNQFFIGLQYKPQPDGAADTNERVVARMQLGDLLDEARAAVVNVEDTMRKELGG